MHNLRDKLIKVHDRLQQAAQQADRDAKTVQLLAVSKTQPAESIRDLYEQGQTRFGENYLQEALAKQARLTDLDVEWHFIGPIQSNKTRDIATHFAWVHSVDRVKIARRLHEQRPDSLPPLNICLQVNIDGEASKSGVAPQDLLELATALADLPRLNLRGLMAIPAARNDYSGQLAAFKGVADVFNELRQALNGMPLDTLSMGMSADLEAAVAAGSTMVRVGTDLFGPRKPINQN